MELTLCTALLAGALLGSANTTPATVTTDHPVRTIEAREPSPLREAIARDSARLSHLVAAETGARRDTKAPKGRNWIQRHPSCFGAMVGFVGGFLIGFLPGDDAIFDDYAAAFNGAVLGGIGAGTGAILGWAGSRDR